MEKWLMFALLSFAMILVAFNMVGALWVIVLDKKKDIAILLIGDSFIISKSN